MKTFLVRGVPASIQQDSWWMDGLIQRPPPNTADTPTNRNRMERPLLLVALIALGDVLLWGVVPGVSLVIFAAAVLLAAFVLSDGRGWGGLILGAVLFLPLLEQMQSLSLLFWVAGLLLGGVWIGLGGWQGLHDTSLSALRLMVHAPLACLRDLAGILGHAPTPDTLSNRLSRFTIGWALPIGLGLIFLSLLLEANPVANIWLERAQTMTLPNPSRIAFWMGIAVAIWPFLRLSYLRQRLTPPMRQGLIGPRRLPGVLNHDAVRRSLILFNMLFAVQTGLDVVYLWGGASLPEGMTYATYAHHGAYPLVVTALLAGSFAVVARPFTAMDPLLRAALILWIVQTIVLVISSLLRLELYVGVYGLTRLRMAAGIWMVVVAGGLGLTCWQVLRHHTAAWLLKRGFALGLLALYGAMFISFDRTIARYNLTNQIVADPGYICALSSAALPEIRKHAPGLCDDRRGPSAPYAADWREWGFRDWRTLRSLAALNAEIPEPTAQRSTQGEQTSPTY